MKTHLPYRDGTPLCERGGRNARTSGDMREVDCHWCWRAWERVMYAEENAVWERRYEAQYAAAADSLGLRHLWDRLSTDTASLRMARGAVGAMLLFLSEIATEDVAA